MTDISINNLTVDYGKTYGLKDISFTIKKGTITGIVGQSGSGKTTLSLALTGLIQCKSLSGSLDIFDHHYAIEDTLSLKKALKNDFGIIFQDPMTFLNPLMKIGKQIAERFQGKNIKEKVYQILDEVGLSDQQYYHRYPHELSGGERQRVLIAIAIAHKPKLLICDEPTSSLDAGTKKQIILLLKKIQSKYQMSMLIISHDLHFIASLTQTCIVLLNGQIVEHGNIFANQKHSYTKQLLFKSDRFFQQNKEKIS
ncbi:MAG TPA: dipeptide/oligopeptide/nickel ABC transporter ATP-binding protein [Chlamydiales bacterium]|mgnify:CR=1 FL=1|nr:dipeptide/oligopeptide/nickel ABC transporter ATP-binding protein [Chlamydiales bacterium]